MEQKILDNMLLEAVLTDEKDEVKRSLKAGANINGQYGTTGTPLILAIRNSSLNAAEELILNGADVNLTAMMRPPALILAVLFDQQKIVSLLLSKGADVNARDIGRSSPLMYALNNGRAEIAAIIQAELDRRELERSLKCNVAPQSREYASV